MLRVVEKSTKENEELRTTLDELLQRGALKMLHEALEAEVDEYIRRHRDARDERGRAQVVRNGKAPARTLVTGSGTLEVRAPRVNDRRIDADGERHRFTSQILPSYMRRAPKVTEVLPILYVRGLSTGDFQAAFAGPAGPGGGRPLADDDHAADGELGSGVCRVAPSRSARRRLRVRRG
jgi:transposase-like protein